MQYCVLAIQLALNKCLLSWWLQAQCHQSRLVQTKVIPVLEAVSLYKVHRPSNPKHLAQMRGEILKFSKNRVSSKFSARGNLPAMCISDIQKDQKKRVEPDLVWLCSWLDTQDGPAESLALRTADCCVWSERTRSAHSMWLWWWRKYTIWRNLWSWIWLSTSTWFPLYRWIKFNVNSNNERQIKFHCQWNGPRGILERWEWWQHSIWSFVLFLFIFN